MVAYYGEVEAKLGSCLYLEGAMIGEIIILPEKLLCSSPQWDGNDSAIIARSLKLANQRVNGDVTIYFSATFD